MITVFPNYTEIIRRLGKKMPRHKTGAKKVTNDGFDNTALSTSQ
jgi:hypothetical protein